MTSYEEYNQKNLEKLMSPTGIFAVATGFVGAGWMVSLFDVQPQQLFKLTVDGFTRFYDESLQSSGFQLTLRPQGDRFHVHG
ncbi:hypothetical protein [Desulfotomaculum sp. 1211_IL3151]|uniref:hypothetical protein n=1 Tax=Desulfotomaculum sp. 1211_IL3151 TaxID=3084055 RepID=UPI002FDABB15